MAIETALTLALSCQCCGKTTAYELSRFMFKNGRAQQLVCSCGQVHATIKAAAHGQWLMSLFCPLCQSCHLFCIDGRDTETRKLYCSQDNTELGIVGAPADVAAAIARHEYDLKKLGADMEAHNPYIIVEMLNRLHDIAERGGLYCECGSFDIEARLLDNGIELSCHDCGGRWCFYAHAEELRYLKSIESLELICKRHFQRK